MAKLQQFALTGNPITEEITATEQVTRTIADKNGLAVVTLTAEPYGGKAVFRYDAILRSMYQDGRELLPGCTLCHRDFAISVIANIASRRYVFGRGVAQLGESPIPVHHFKTKLPSLRWYRGYELGIVFDSGSEDYYSVKLNGQSLESIQYHENPTPEIVYFDLSSNPIGEEVATITISGPVFTFFRYEPENSTARKYLWKSKERIAYTLKRNPSVGDRATIEGDITKIDFITARTLSPIQPYNGTLSIGDDEVEAFDEIQVAEIPVPAHPFYIRWINQYGGYDYFMFACNHKRKLSLTANEYYEPYGSDGVKKSYHKAAKEVVEVSTGIADKQTLHALAEMPLSPDIRWYKESTQEWVPIQIESGDTEIMANQPTGELVFSFVLPLDV